MQFAFEKQGIGVFFAQHHAQEIHAVGGQPQIGRAFEAAVEEAFAIGGEAHGDARVEHVDFESAAVKQAHIGRQEAAFEHEVEGFNQRETRRQGGQAAADLGAPLRQGNVGQGHFVSFQAALMP